jgi:hypothetical protein
MPLEDDCIRIIYLQPRRAKWPAEEIECTLAHVAFGDKPEYKALSYAWGDGTAKRTIQLDGTKFKVGENLAAALIYIRGLESAGEKPQAILIDAICLYVGGYRRKYHRNLRFGPPFSEGFRFASRVNTSLFINFAFASPYLFFVSIYVCLL